MSVNSVRNTDNRGGEIIQTTIVQRIELHSIFRSFFQSIKVTAGRFFGDTKDVTQLCDSFFNGEVNSNDVVKVRGFLSQYGLLTKPLTFQKPENMVGRIVSSEDTSHRKKLSPVSQIPVQNFPRLFDPEKGWYKILFLYPIEFDGFVLPLDSAKRQRRDENDYLTIDQKVKGIPILVSHEFDSGSLEHFVTLTGVIGSSSTEIAQKLLPFFDETVFSLNSNFYRPYSGKPEGMCLDCRVANHYDLSITGELEKLPASLYVEGHIDSLIEESISNIAQECSWSLAGNSLSLSFSSLSQNGHMNVVTDDDIIVKSSSPNIFGFYTETDLLDSNVLEKDYHDLHKKWLLFSRNSKALLNKERGINSILKPDFVSDGRRSHLFHFRGLLKAKDIIRDIKNSDLELTSKWINRR